MSSYYNWTIFSNIYLEDSFVLNISESVDDFIFDMEFVLNEKHPLYTSPKIGEQYCYQRGKIIFSGVSKINWSEKSISSSLDANGEEDYGNIDSLEKVENDTYKIIGDWGSLHITASEVKVVI